MKPSTQSVTAAGNYQFSVPRGSSYTLAVSGTIGTCTVRAQYLTNVAGTITAVNYTTGTSTLVNALGELTLVNVGSTNEINVNVSATTAVTLVVNPSMSLGRERL